MDSINHTGDNIILSSPIASNISQSQLEFDIKKFTKYQNSTVNDTKNTSKYNKSSHQNSTSKENQPTSHKKSTSKDNTNTPLSTKTPL